MALALRADLSWLALVRGKCGHHQADCWVRELAQLEARVNAEVRKRGARFKLVLDSRENHLFPFFQGFSWASRQELPCFDLVWLDANDHIAWALERKTLADLRSSVHSGHYSNQRTRMLQSAVPREKMAFLCEGVAPSAVDRMQELNCELNCVVRDGIAWRRTLHLVDTVAFVMRKTLALLQHGESATEGVRIPEAFEAFHDVKTGLSNPRVAYLKMLACVPGLSGPMAAAVHEVYPTMVSLHSALACDAKKTVETLSNLTFKSTVQRVKQHAEGGCKPRKIGPAVASRLLRFMNGESDPDKPKTAKRKASDDLEEWQEPKGEPVAKVQKPTSAGIPKKGVLKWANFGM